VSIVRQNSITLTIRRHMYIDDKIVHKTFPFSTPIRTKNQTYYNKQNENREGQNVLWIGYFAAGKV